MRSTLVIGIVLASALFASLLGGFIAAKSHTSIRSIYQPTGSSSNSQNILNVDVTNIKLSGYAPQGLAVDAKTGFVYTANNGYIVGKCGGNDNGAARNKIANQQTQPGGNTLSIVNPAKGQEITRVDTSGSPIWPLVDNDRGVVYTADSSNGGFVDIFKLNSGEKVASIEVGGTPHDLGLDSASRILIVSNTHDNSGTYYSVIDANTRQKVVDYKTVSMPHGIVIDQAKRLAYMAGVGDGTIAVIDMKTGQTQTTFSTGEKTFRNTNLIAFSPSERKIFLNEGNGFNTDIEVINADTHEILGKISVPANPYGIALDDSKHLLYAALPDTNQVAVANVDKMKVLGYILVDSCPFAVKLDTNRNLGFATSMVNSTLSVFDLNKVSDSINSQ